MSTGTTFASPLKVGGPDTGVTTTNTETNVAWSKSITVSAGGRDATFTLPDNSYLYGSNNFVTTKVSGIAQGAKVVIGDGSTDNLYGTTNAVSAVGVYGATLTESAVSAKTISVKVTASVAGSAADLADVQIDVQIIGGIRG